jgi:hypothetical protein
MRLLALLPVIVTALVGALVGVRLLRLGWRAHRAPELCVGGGLFLVCAAGQPFTVAGRAPALFGSALGDALFAFGIALNVAGIALIYPSRGACSAPARHGRERS